MAKTVQQYVHDVEAKINDILRLNEPFERAVRNIVARQAGRIFIEGKNSSGGIIGQYSTHPLYINPNTSSPRKGAIKGRVAGISFVKFEGLEPTTGKYGEHIFTAETAYRGVKGTKAGDPHRTTYMAGGYKEFRNRIGRRIDRVNLTLTGDFMKDYTNAQIPSKAAPIKISTVEYHVMLKRPLNIKKRQGFEDKYGTIFDLMREEREAFFRTLEFNFRKALNDG